MAESKNLKVVLDTFIEQNENTNKTMRDMITVMVKNGEESASLKREMCDELKDLKQEMRSLNSQFNNYTLDIHKDNMALQNHVEKVLTNDMTHLIKDEVNKIKKEVSNVKGTGKWLTIILMLIGLIGSLFVCLNSVLVSRGMLEKIYILLTQIGDKIIP